MSALTAAPTRVVSARRSTVVKCSAEKPAAASRREFMLKSVNVGVLGAMFTWGASPRPSGLGVVDYGGGVKTLNLCPPSPNCISTAEELNDLTHFVPSWSYKPQDNRKRTGVTQAEAMAELKEVITSTKPDKFTPTVVKDTGDYLYVEYESPTFGFIDDVEFWFDSTKPGIVEYRSASRIGESDGDINRKRIKALRVELQKKGWASVGF